MMGFFDKLELLHSEKLFYFPLKNLFSAYTPSTRTPRTRKMPAIPAQSIERVTGRSAVDMG